MTLVPFRIHWYSIGLVVADAYMHLTEIKSLRWSSVIELSLCHKNLTLSSKQWRLKLNTQFSPLPPCSF